MSQGREHSSAHHTMYECLENLKKWNHKKDKNLAIYG
jgi:hypothetical protein